MIVTLANVLGTVSGLALNRRIGGLSVRYALRQPSGLVGIAVLNRIIYVQVAVRKAKRGAAGGEELKSVLDAHEVGARRFGSRPSTARASLAMNSRRSWVVCDIMLHVVRSQALSPSLSSRERSTGVRKF